MTITSSMGSRSSPSFTEQVPPEIWSHIFDIACLDDGYTARSLSLVSRHIQAVSQKHRYLTINISSGRQMIALENQLSQSGIIAEGKLKTRFICITLPVDCAEEAYPDEPGVWEPESDTDDSDYQDSESQFPGGFPFPVSESDSDEEGSSTQYDLMEESSRQPEADPTEVHELLEEAADLRWLWVIGTVEDLKDANNSIGRLRYQIYGAMRRLLEACSGTLEVLSFYHRSRIPIAVSALIPPLPRLIHLSIGMPPCYYTGYSGGEDMHLTPADGGGPRTTVSLAEDTPFAGLANINEFRWLGYCQKQKGSHVWRFVRGDFDESSLPGLLTGWWLNDVNGGSGIPDEEELDGIHGHGYQYHTDDDL